MTLDCRFLDGRSDAEEALTPSVSGFTWISGLTCFREVHYRAGTQRSTTGTSMLSYELVLGAPRRKDVRACSCVCSVPLCDVRSTVSHALLFHVPIQSSRQDSQQVCLDLYGGMQPLECLQLSFLYVHCSQHDNLQTLQSHTQAPCWRTCLQAPGSSFRTLFTSVLLLAFLLSCRIWSRPPPPSQPAFTDPWLQLRTWLHLQSQH
jgi:hypothetical protein